MAEGDRARPDEDLRRWRAPWTGRVGLAVLSVVAVMLTGLHYVDPESGPGQATYLLCIVGAPLLAALGTRRQPPGSRLVAGAVAAGLASFAVGDLVWFASHWAGSVPEVSFADLFWLLSYAGIGAAFAALVVLEPSGEPDHGSADGSPGGSPGGSAGRRRHRVDLDALVDALTIVTVSVAVLWVLLVGDLISNDVAWQTRVVRAVYPILDAVILGLVVRALWLRRARSTIALPLVVGVVCWLVADLGFLAAATTGVGERALDVLWMAGCLLMGLGVWAPSRPHTVRDASYREGPRSRLLIAIGPLLVPPALLVVDLATGTGGSLAIAVAMVVLTGLTFVRTSGLLAAERTAREEALAASRAKSDFLATMSHEIRTPLNGVLGLNELLLGTRLDARQREYATGVRTAGTSLLALVNDVLDLSKVEAGRIDLESVPFSPAEVVGEAVELVARPARDKGLELHTDLDGRAGTLLVGDPARLRQVVVNLLSNAVKFTEAGAVEVRLAVGEDTPATLRLVVADTGIGMTPEVQARVFDAFTQADSSTTRRYGGTGLGLTIVQRLVEQMGGRLALDSSASVGSRFTVELTLPRAAAGGAGSGAGVEPAPRLRVLVVHDDEIDRVVALAVLSRLGHTGVEAPDTDTALEALRGGSYDAALLGCGHPGAVGFTVALRRRAEEEEDRHQVRLPLVALTAGTDDEDEEDRVRAAGMDGHLATPVTIEALGAALAAAVGVAPG